MPPVFGVFDFAWSRVLTLFSCVILWCKEKWHATYGLKFCLGTEIRSGPGSSVEIATGYRLDGPGSNPGGDEIFHPSRPALGPTQPPVQWVPGLSGGKVRPERAADHSPPSSAAVMEE